MLEVSARWSPRQWEMQKMKTWVYVFLILSPPLHCFPIVYPLTSDAIVFDTKTNYMSLGSERI